MPIYTWHDDNTTPWAILADGQLKVKNTALAAGMITASDVESFYFRAWSYFYIQFPPDVGLDMGSPPLPISTKDGIPTGEEYCRIKFKPPDGPAPRPIGRRTIKFLDFNKKWDQPGQQAWQVTVNWPSHPNQEWSDFRGTGHWSMNEPWKQAIYEDGRRRTNHSVTCDFPRPSVLSPK
jgi:hypothetical protein